MSSLDLYTPLEIRLMISKNQTEVAHAIYLSRSFYSKLENSKRAWTLAVATRWLSYVLDELDKLPEDTVDFSRVVDFHDLNTLNEQVVSVTYWWEGVGTCW